MKLQKRDLRSKCVRREQVTRPRSVISVCALPTGGRRTSALLAFRFAWHDLAIPYLHFNPAHCFVLEKAGSVVGYIVTASDTREYEKWQQGFWWPKVKEKLKAFKAETDSDRHFLNALAQNQLPAPSYADDFPAHLHINLLPEAQGGGNGRKLMRAALEQLRADGVSGIHLEVNRENLRAVGFYEVMGFGRVAKRVRQFMRAAFDVCRSCFSGPRDKKWKNEGVVWTC